MICASKYDGYNHAQKKSDYIHVEGTTGTNNGLWQAIKVPLKFCIGEMLTTSLTKCTTLSKKPLGRLIMQLLIS